MAAWENCCPWLVVAVVVVVGTVEGVGAAAAADLVFEASVEVLFEFAVVLVVTAVFIAGTGFVTGTMPVAGAVFVSVTVVLAVGDAVRIVVVFFSFTFMSQLLLFSFSETA